MEAFATETDPCPVVVVGGSAGALEPLRTLVAGLPGDFTGVVLVVLHTPSTSPRLLSQLLGKVTPLACSYARDGEPLEGRHIYIAPPDRHLVVEDHRIRLMPGPRQNWSRPAIDPLFESAARVFGSCVVGVILSGMLDDGTRGLRAVKDAGGVAIVQSPVEATHPSMPENAKRHVEVDYSLPVSDIARVLVSLAQEHRADVRPLAPRLEPAGSNAAPWPEAKGPFSLICPDCGGAMVEETKGTLLHYRCFLGHTFGAQTLCESQIVEADRALWTALRNLEEAAVLNKKIVAHARQHNWRDQVPDLERQLHEIQNQVSLLRALLYGEDE